MSLSNIQDNLMKTHLVQQTQTHEEHINRSQEIGRSSFQQEHQRQRDEVVLSLHHSENNNIHPDKDREKENSKRKRKKFISTSTSSNNSSESNPELSIINTLPTRKIDITI